VHLLHPALVHFAIAFLVAGGGLEAWGILARRRGAERFGGALLVAGVLALLPTAASGFLALNVVTLPPAAATTASRHEKAGILILAVFLALMLWKGWYRGTIPPGGRAVYAAVLLAAAALVLYASFLGGTLVYGFGVGTLTNAP
jgi:uncharacterized membrane protein